MTVRVETHYSCDICGVGYPIDYTHRLVLSIKLDKASELDLIIQHKEYTKNDICQNCYDKLTSALESIGVF